jgi:hypothetical protein
MFENHPHAMELLQFVLVAFPKIPIEVVERAGILTGTFFRMVPTTATTIIFIIYIIIGGDIGVGSDRAAIGKPPYSHYIALHHPILGIDRSSAEPLFHWLGRQSRDSEKS